MNKPFGNDDPRLAAYVSQLYTPEDEVLAEVRARSAASKFAWPAGKWAMSTS